MQFAVLPQDRRGQCSHRSGGGNPKCESHHQGISKFKFKWTMLTSTEVFGESSSYVMP